jgi:thymidylate kinase
MNPNPKSSRFKVAFTGTNSSGKTTMALETTARLKRQYHVLAEVVSSQDRKITWKDDHFPVDPRAHYGMISNLVKAEVEAELKGDADIVITDRSVLDLYAIALTDHTSDPKVLGMEGYIRSWMSTYTHVIYLPPLEYQEDGKRPPNEFRMRTHETLRQLIKNWNLPNVIDGLSRPEAFQLVLDAVGKTKVTPIFAEREKWQAIARELGVTLMVKKSEWPSTSDTDVWLVLEHWTQMQDGFLLAAAKAAVKTYFGSQVDAEFLTVPDEALACKPSFEHNVYRHTD